jgi:hypothetical protein
MNTREYVSFLVHTFGNFTSTHYANHSHGISHDAVSDFLKRSRISSSSLWELAQQLIEDGPESCLILDDSVQEKRYSRFIELVKHQYSGAVGGLTRGICVVNLVHSNDGEYVPIDYRIYDPHSDGKTKNEHFREMLIRAISDKNIKAKTVLFDSWYASVDNLKLIHRSGRYFITTLKSNRLVSPSKAAGYIHLADLTWDSSALIEGMLVRLKEVPFPIRLFKLVAKDGHVDWVITNDLDSTLKAHVVQSTNAVRWQIEQMHRELKQLTGIGKCQSRKARAQRNHIACAYQAYLALKVQAKKLNQTAYTVKNSILIDIFCQMFLNPKIPLLAKK